MLFCEFPKTTTIYTYIYVPTGLELRTFWVPSHCANTRLSNYAGFIPGCISSNCLINYVTHQYINATQNTPHKTSPGEGLQSLIALFLATSTTEGEGGYVFTPFCLSVNCRNPSDFGNYVVRLCVSVCLSVCLCVCLPYSSHTVSAIMTKLGTDIGHGPT